MLTFIQDLTLHRNTSLILHDKQIYEHIICQRRYKYKQAEAKQANISGGCLFWAEVCTCAQ